MNKFKQSKNIILMFMILLVITSIPLFYTEYYIQHKLNEVSVYSIQTSKMDARDEVSQNYNIWEHLNVMSDEPLSLTVYSNAQNNIMNSISESELRQMMENQLTRIHEYNALPAIDFSDLVEISFYKDTYMCASSSQEYTDVSYSELILSVWIIYAEYQDFYLNVCMDVETSAIYDISLISKNADFLYPTDISENGFFEYLISFSEIPNDNEEIFSANSNYTERKICLYLSSINKNTGNNTVYQFATRHDINIILYKLSSTSEKVLVEQ